MKIKNLIINTLIVSLFIGISSCSSDSNDDNPTVITVSTSDFTISIDENPVNGQVIGTVTGSTNQGSVTFSIIEQTPSGAFEIDSNTGELTVVDVSLFDFETNAEITGTIKVANGSVFENSNTLITINDVNEENVYNGDLFFLTQQEVDDFGANNFTGITGDLRIGNYSSTPNTSINDLSSLVTLTSIGGYLNVASNEALTSLEGLNNISEIGGRLSILDNENLISINVFNNINSISGQLFIALNDALANLDGLNNITTIGESLLIQENSSLVNINGLNSITNVGDQISISDNDLLLNIDGLSNIETAGDDYFGDIYITNNSSLLSINGLHNITIVNGGFSIGGNPSLVNLNGIENIISVGGNFYISENPALINIDGLQNLTSVGADFTIYQNEMLLNLDGLSNLNSVSYLRMIGNSSLSDFCGLNNLVNDGDIAAYEAVNNAYNPTQQDIIDGNCSL